MDIGTTCCICHEEITSFVNLSGKRCVWCQRTVHEFCFLQFLIHSECVDALGTYCDFGCHASYIISPSFVQSPFESTHTRTNPPASSQNPPPPTLTTSHPTLLHSLSDHGRTSFSPPMPFIDPDSNELRCRKGSDTSDGDDLSIGSSPPPNLTEYRVRDFSDRFLSLPVEKELTELKEHSEEHSEKELDKTEAFSWQTVLKDLK